MLLSPRSCLTHLILGANTLAALISRNSLFVSEKTVLPNQWGMLTHFAFRPALAKLVELSSKERLSSGIQVRVRSLVLVCPFLSTS